MNTQREPGGTITLRGSLCGDPTIRYDRSGVATTTFCFKDLGGETTEATVVGELAVNVALSLTKGVPVVAVGEVGSVLGTFVASDVLVSLTSGVIDTGAIREGLS